MVINVEIVGVSGDKMLVVELSVVSLASPSKKARQSDFLIARIAGLNHNTTSTAHHCSSLTTTAIHHRSIRADNQAIWDCATQLQRRSPGGEILFQTNHLNCNLTDGWQMSML